MDKLRGLTEFVQRFGVGGAGVGGSSSGFGASGGDSGGGAEGQLKDINAILAQLPLTKEFLNQLPRKQVEETAAQNEAKAAKALTLLKLVDALISSHTTTTSTLASLLPTLTSLSSSLETTTSLAASLTTQLSTLSTTISTLSAEQTQHELSQLQKAENARFEAYAKERRDAVRRKKEEWAAELDRFRLERRELGDEVEGLQGKGGRRGTSTLPRSPPQLLPPTPA
ncbi:hypothetical protein BDZ91DRAFT_553654 [Kalaharituber pfeilii]|nr:hypothetical protein BDZ91DRAFT_553654 [Kalaharituber pfeilii]